MTTTKWPKRTFVGHDGTSYVTSEFGSLVGIKVKDFTFEHIFLPFYHDHLDGKTSSSDDQALWSDAEFTFSKTSIEVVDAPKSKTYRMPTAIKPMDEEAPDGGSEWVEMCKKGWPCRMGTYRNERTGEYEWSASVFFKRQLFELIVELYVSKRKRWSGESEQPG